MTDSAEQPAPFKLEYASSSGVEPELVAVSTEPAIKLEYASTSTRTRTTRIVGAMFSLCFAFIGVILAGPAIALIIDATTNGRAQMLAAIAMLCIGGAFCFAAWFVQKRYVFPTQ